MNPRPRLPRASGAHGFLPALLGAVAIGVASVAGITVLHHSSPHVQVRVLGEKFTPAAGTGNPASNGTSGNGNGNKGNGLGNGGGAKLGFTMAASVSGLVLGAPSVLPVQITNPSSNNGTLTVNSLDVSAADVVDHGVTVCAGSNLKIGRYDSTAAGATSYVIASGATQTVPLPIVLQDLSTDQTGCNGKSLTITVNGVATVTR